MKNSATPEAIHSHPGTLLNSTSMLLVCLNNKKKPTMEKNSRHKSTFLLLIMLLSSFFRSSLLNFRLCIFRYFLVLYHSLFSRLHTPILHLSSFLCVFNTIIMLCSAQSRSRNEIESNKGVMGGENDDEDDSKR